MVLKSLYTSVLLGLAVASLAAAAVDLRTKYPFSSTLLSDPARGYYTLHWNFSRETQYIYFAVNVSTTGWVGFGLSPNGGMVGSDVVIGWVNKDGAAFFKDRYAVAQALPPVDSSQDWCLISANEKDGYTIMEFKRNFTTCDVKDRDITPDTARVIWSFNLNDPQNDNDDNVIYHTARGSASLNLLGGNPNQQAVGNQSYLDITVSDISPAITPHAREFVHHILVYLCPIGTRLNNTEVGISRRCSGVTESLGNCLSNGVLIGGWAVGGDDFVYPDGISFPVGGIGEEQYLVMQTHYDNPNQRSGVVDSSGLRFYYNMVEPRQRAGVMYLGHDVVPTMIVPPRTSRYTISSYCTAECTGQFIPPEGITVIGNLLHTHLVGRSVTISHYRRNATTNQLVELEPLDQNLNYDFDYQQFTQLSSPRTILPGDILVMQCTYDTSGRDSLTLGGESTEEEMCLSFPIFYPRPSDGSALVHCSSFPNSTNAFNGFGYYVVKNNLSSTDALQNNFFPTLSNLDWAGNPMLSSSLQDSLRQGSINSLCYTERGNYSFLSLPVPSPDVRYMAPNKCIGVPKGQCVKDETEGAPPLVSASVFLVIAAVLHSLSITIM